MVRVAELVAPGIAAIQPYQPGKPIEELERELGPSLPAGGVIKLASNENPLGPSPRARAVLLGAVADVHRYPDGSAFALRRALADARPGVRYEELVVGNGSNEILDLLVRTFCRPGDEVIAPAQTFACYQLSAQAHGVDYREVARGSDFVYDLDALGHAVGPKTRMVFLANPDNPTGAYASREAVERLMARLPEQVIFAVDEAYCDYAVAPDYPDTLTLHRLHPLTVTLRTFSKIYGLAGLRCGWAVAPAEMVAYLDRVRNPFNVNSLAQVAAIAALGDQDHLQRSRRLNAEGMVQLRAGLERLGVSYLPSQCNFLLVDVAPREGRRVFDVLLGRGVIVRPVASYRLPHHLRVTIGTADENHRFLDALTAALA